MTHKQAAQALGISEKTVKTPVSHLPAKLSVRDRTQASVVAVGQPRKGVEASACYGS